MDNNFTNNNQNENGSQENYNPYSYNPYTYGKEENAARSASSEGNTSADNNTGYAGNGTGSSANGTGSYAGNSSGSYTGNSYSNNYSGNNYSSNYSGNNYGGNNYGGNASSGRPSGRRKKSQSFGKTLGKTVAVALVFGLVAGGTFSGISYAGSKLSSKGTKAETSAAAESAEESSASSSTVTEDEKTETGYASDLTDVSSIAAEVMPSIVAITNTSTVTYQSMFGGTQSYDSTSCGSGIIIDKDDIYLYIATNNHVVDGAESLSVTFSDGNDTTVDAETRGTYSSGDLAVVQVKLADLSDDLLDTIKVITIGDSSALKVGEPTIAIGNALGYGQSVTTGIVSALGRSVSTQDSTTGTTYTHDNLIQTDAAINPGNSGGALLNAEGELIGINSVKYSETSVEGIGYAIPMEDAYPIIESLIEKGSYLDTQTTYLGIAGIDVTSAYAQAYNMPEGVYIKTIYTGSGAENAGLQTGDIITAIDDTEITCMDDLKAALKNYTPGDSATFTVYRQSGDGYKGYEVDVTLMSADEMQSISQ